MCPPLKAQLAFILTRGEKNKASDFKSHPHHLKDTSPLLNQRTEKETAGLKRAAFACRLKHSWEVKEAFGHLPAATQTSQLGLGLGSAAAKAGAAGSLLGRKPNKSH